MKLTAVVTCHERHHTLRELLANLDAQTRPPDETLVYLSDVPRGQLDALLRDFPTAHFVVVANEDDWGHGKRARGLAIASGDAVGWFNDDDDYHPDYLARLMAELEAGADVAYCNWSYSPTACEFSLGSSTAGNFLVRTALARSVGWRERDYCADGHFINALAVTADRIVRVDQVLYTHNARS